MYTYKYIAGFPRQSYPKKIIGLARLLCADKSLPGGILYCHHVYQYHYFVYLPCM